MAGKIVERAITVLAEKDVEGGGSCVVLVAWGSSIEDTALSLAAGVELGKGVRNREDAGVPDEPEVITDAVLEGMGVGLDGRLEGQQI